jgi:hypothetical protein
MGKFDRRSRDQRRKAKLKKRAERSHAHEPLAYHGQKYKTEEYVGLMLSAETGIFETYVISDRKLTDDIVEAALERLILEMRQGPLPTLDPDEVVKFDEETLESLVIRNIRINWQIQEEELPPGRDDRIGVLRTILGSLETWRSKSMHSQGYLRYLEGFMKKVGVSVTLVEPETGPILAPDVEDPLLEVGRDWIDGGDEDAASAFAEEVEASLREGNAERVIEVCQQLLGEARNAAVVPILQAFALRGHRALQDRPGPPPTRGIGRGPDPDR